MAKLYYNDHDCDHFAKMVKAGKGCIYRHGRCPCVESLIRINDAISKFIDYLLMSGLPSLWWLLFSKYHFGWSAEMKQVCTRDTPAKFDVHRTPVVTIRHSLGEIHEIPRSIMLTKNNNLITWCHPIDKKRARVGKSINKKIKQLFLKFKVDVLAGRWRAGVFRVPYI